MDNEDHIIKSKSHDTKSGSHAVDNSGHTIDGIRHTIDNESQPVKNEDNAVDGDGQTRAKEDWGLTRRQFIRTATTAAIVGPAGLAAACQRCQSVPDPAPDAPDVAGKPVDAAPATSSQKRSKVVLVRDENVLGADRKGDPDILSRMLDEAVGALFDTSPDEAWTRLARPEDIVGIKTNIWQFLATPKGLEEAIRRRLEGIGIPAENIAIDDRDVRSNPVFEKATALFNVRPLRTHHWAGVGSCIKNYITFSAVPFSWHTDSCANLAGVWDLPECKGRTRLNILVMLTPLFHGKGPHHFNAKYTWDYKGLVVGVDPVAVDATGVRILEAKRRVYFGRDEPLAVSPKHIRVAEQKYGLGVADPERIDVIRLGWMEEALL